MRRMRPAGDPTPGSPADACADADPESFARQILLRRLTMAPRTEAELREDLRVRGVADDVASRVLARFVEVGLINDAEYARMWTQSRHRSKGDARTVIRRQLRAKGVDDDIVEHALEELSVQAERDRARALVQAKLASTARLDEPARVRRLTAMLQRRGYPAGTAFAVVREVLEETSADDG